MADNQAVASRFSEAVWITDYITPDNPDVIMLYQRLTGDITSLEERVVALWRYVANIPYRGVVGAKLIVGGKSYVQHDMWLYPAETICLSPVANCANKSFLLASLLRNELPAQDVHCIMGHVTVDGIEAHAWVSAKIYGNKYLLETTQPSLPNPLLPIEQVEAYEPSLRFNDHGVESIEEMSLDEHFGFCAIPFLRHYICSRCSGIEGR